MYPENWKLTEQAPDEIEGSPREISLEAPSGCMWVLHVFGGGTDPAEVLDQVIQGLDQQYEDFEYTPHSSDEILGNPVIGGEADFYCLDFLVTAKIQVIDTPENVFCILSQAESRDFESMNQVFLAIATSLVQADLPSNV
jgi:hypothetical protein